MVGHNMFDQVMSQYDNEIYNERQSYERELKEFDRKYARELKAAGVDKMDAMVEKDDEYRKQLKTMKKIHDKAVKFTKVNEKQVEKAAQEVDKTQLAARKENLMKMKAQEREQQAERDKAKEFMKRRGIHRATPDRGARGRGGR